MKERCQDGNDHEPQERLNEAVRLRDQGNLAEAEEALLQLVEESPQNLGVALVRAGVLFDMGRFDEARVIFQAIVDSKPDHELASRGLFHSLWKLGEYDAAFEEMKRFVSMAESNAYAELLRDMKADLQGG